MLVLYKGPGRQAQNGNDDAGWGQVWGRKGAWGHGGGGGGGGSVTSIVVTVAWPQTQAVTV